MASAEVVVMACPKCESGIVSVNKADGFVQGVVEECLICHAIWSTVNGKVMLLK